LRSRSSRDFWTPSFRHARCPPAGKPRRWRMANRYKLSMLGPRDGSAAPQRPEALRARSVLPWGGGPLAFPVPWAHARNPGMDAPGSARARNPGPLSAGADTMHMCVVLYGLAPCPPRSLEKTKLRLDAVRRGGACSREAKPCQDCRGSSRIWIVLPASHAKAVQQHAGGTPRASEERVAARVLRAFVLRAFAQCDARVNSHVALHAWLCTGSLSAPILPGRHPRDSPVSRVILTNATCAAFVCTRTAKGRKLLCIRGGWFCRLQCSAGPEGRDGGWLLDALDQEQVPAGAPGASTTWALPHRDRRWCGGVSSAACNRLPESRAVFGT